MTSSIVFPELAVCNRRLFLELGTLGFATTFLAGCTKTVEPGKGAQNAKKEPAAEHSILKPDFEYGGVDGESMRETEINIAGWEDIAPAKLVVNRYGAVVLNSPNMLIVDLDHPPAYGTRLSRLLRCTRFDCGVIHRSTADPASWRVYRTLAGFRAICTDRVFGEQDLCRTREVQWGLGADYRYVALCSFYGCYRARLTPKPWRVFRGCQNCACKLVGVIGGIIHPQLRPQLRVHDSLSLPKGRRDTYLA